jgi:hypothetical protein
MLMIGTPKVGLTIAHRTITLKLATWSMIAATLMLTLLPGLAEASTGQLSSRSTVLSSSVPGAATNLDINVTAATTSANVRSYMLQVCTSPLQGAACTAPTGFSWGSTVSIQAVNGSPFTNSYAGSPSGSDFLLTNATGNAVNAGDAVRFVIQGSANPTSATQFYIRATSCSDTTCNVASPYTNNIDFGAMAVSTAQVITQTSTVQESLVFCVGTTNTASCGSMSGSAVPLISAGSSSNPMSSTGTSYGNAYMDCQTNAQNGYVITYVATPFTGSSGHTITSAASTGTGVNTGGAEEFGFNLVSNPIFGSLLAGPYGAGVNPSGATISTGYDSSNIIAYNTSGPTQVASLSGPGASANSQFTITYGANVSSTTPAGVYTSTQTFIATGTY